MKKERVIDAQKAYECSELLKIIKETVSADSLARICLNNYTLKTIAGYTPDSNDENYNPYIKSYIDKLVYDEHNKDVKKAKEVGDKEELKRLSTKIMDMAGYLKDGEYSRAGRVNQYAKSFVDRTLLDRQVNRLYKAVESGNKEELDSAYRKIYQMSSYSNDKPYGVVNEYAQTFVDNRIEKYIQMGIHTPKEDIEPKSVAI